MAADIADEHCILDRAWLRTELREQLADHLIVLEDILQSRFSAIDSALREPPENHQARHWPSEPAWLAVPPERTTPDSEGLPVFNTQLSFASDVPTGIDGTGSIRLIHFGVETEIANSKQHLESSGVCLALTPRISAQVSETSESSDLGELVSHSSSVEPSSKIAFSQTVRKRIFRSAVIPHQAVRSMRRFSATRAIHTPNTFLVRVVESQMFETIAGLVIVGNAILVGYQMDASMKCLMSHHTDAHNISAVATSCLRATASMHPSYELEYVFNSIFTLELVIRLVAYGWTFLFGKDVNWNLLDAACVMTWLFEMVDIKNRESVSFLRLLRIMRTLRAMRAQGVFESIGVVRRMVESTLASLWSLVSVFVLLILWNFLFSLCFMQAILARAASYDARILQLYRDLPTSMMTLFEAVTGGRDWSEAAIGGFEDHVELIALLGFIMFILINIFAVMNIVTGVFVEEALSSAQLDKEFLAQQKKEEDRALKRQVERDLWLEFQSAVVPTAVFQRWLESKHAIGVLQVFGLNPSAEVINELIHLVDSTSSGVVRTCDFVQCCLRIKGPAQSIDLLHVLTRVDQNALLLEEALNRIYDAIPTSERHIKEKLLCRNTHGLADLNQIH